MIGRGSDKNKLIKRYKGQGICRDMVAEVMEGKETLDNFVTSETVIEY